jgi:hypothetical protein
VELYYVFIQQEIIKIIIKMLYVVDNVGPNSHSHASKYPIWERIKKLPTAEKIAIAGLQVCSCGATYLEKFADFQLGSGSLQVAGLQLWT